MFSSALHPRAPGGSAIGGQFIPKGGAAAPAKRGGSGRATSSRATTRRTSATVPPNGLGYTNAQWSQLRKWEARAKAGKPLTAHQRHALHVAHMKRLAAHGITPKPATRKRTALKSSGRIAITRSRTTTTRKPRRTAVTRARTGK